MAKKSKYLCKVQKCPMEFSEVANEKYRDLLQESFGDDVRIVNCEKIKADNKRVLFCEMLVEGSKVNLSKLPKGLSIVMEIES